MTGITLKLQKQLSRRRETKKGIVEYPKFIFVIPPDVVKRLDWEDTESEFEAVAKNGKLVIEKK